MQEVEEAAVLAGCYRWR